MEETAKARLLSRAAIDHGISTLATSLEHAPNAPKDITTDLATALTLPSNAAIATQASLKHALASLPSNAALATQASLKHALASLPSNAALATQASLKHALASLPSNAALAKQASLKHALSVPMPSDETFYNASDHFTPSKARTLKHALSVPIR